MDIIFQKVIVAIVFSKLKKYMHTHMRMHSSMQCVQDAKKRKEKKSK